MVASHTYDEIISQPDALKQTLQMVKEQRFHEKDPDLTVFSGCGTSYYLAVSAARFFQEVTGKPALAVPASEVILHPEQVFAKGLKYQLVIISRSGTTSEAVAACKTIAGRKEIGVMAVTCHAGSALARLAAESIVLDHIKEKSVVMTQSFTNMLYALQLYSAKTSQNDRIWNELTRLPEQMDQVIGQLPQIRELAENLQYRRFIFLGSGVLTGIAREATLKLKEMTQTECESYSTLEFRHGPISIVDDRTAVILFTSEKTKELDAPLMEEIRSFGGHAVAVGHCADQVSADTALVIETDLSGSCQAILLLPHFQMLAYCRAVKLGLNPDQPRNLNQVVKISIGE
ncbi:SIS domain-containing protein [Lihuaxuella thermophila]|uniref:Glucosamine--fructose-6-phosphate aminotransferase (Isomerizing) n=1 Tax=Lihuaxuella thermophila TaxID=1173111 RepID=A0A1H8CPU6_9BACL|nr:SIS domain-containing protein [Lihuaxuella thermophila]SEM96147.1 glucosamine--fructose-6-phosphate aminotransferase (isomerizing) [Lihuaxuella thermophila]